MAKLLTGSIDVSKIDKSKLYKSEKTGKTYLNVSIWINDELDKYGNCAAIQQSTGKGEDKIYLGNLKEYKRDDVQEVVAEEVKTAVPADGADDLPW
jgi:hypothetical protein